MLVLQQPQLASSRSNEPLDHPIITPVTNTQSLLDPQRHRQIGERFLSQGDAFQALPHLLRAAPKNLDLADPELTFRIALCYESANDWHVAKKLYQGLMHRVTDAPLLIAARLGLCRNLIRTKEFAQAQDLLWRSFLIMDQHRSSPLHQEVVLLLGQAVHQPVFRGQAMWQEDRNLVLIEPQSRPVEHLQNLASAKHNRIESVTDLIQDRQIEIKNAFQSGDHSYDVIFDVQAREVDIIFALQWLSENLGVSISVTDTVVETLGEQMINLDLKGIELALLLDTITLPLGLTWQTDGQTVYVVGKAEVTNADWRRANNRLAGHLIRRAMMIAPDHPEHDLMQLMHGIVQYRSGDVSQAISTFEAIVQQKTNESSRQAAYFNLSTIYERNHQFRKAAKSLIHVVEGHAPVALQAAALFQLGRLQLNNGELEKSVSSFSKANHIATDNQLKSVAKLGMAMAYLLDERGGLSHAAIYESRNIFDGSTHHSAAVAIAQIANWQMRRQNISNTEIEELLSSIEMATWPDSFKAAGKLLTAQTYHQLGFPMEAINQLNQVLDLSSDSWIHQRIAAELSAMLLNVKQTREAKHIIENLLPHDPAAHHASLLIQLANIEFEQSNFEQSLIHCQTILALDISEDQKSETLLLLGNIYQQRGLHHHASLCFSGVIPNF